MSLVFICLLFSLFSYWTCYFLLPYSSIHRHRHVQWSLTMNFLPVFIYWSLEFLFSCFLVLVYPTFSYSHRSVLHVPIPPFFFTFTCYWVINYPISPSLCSKLFCYSFFFLYSEYSIISFLFFYVQVPFCSLYFFFRFLTLLSVLTIYIYIFFYRDIFLTAFFLAFLFI